MGDRTLTRFVAALALSFSCLSLSVLPMSKGWGQNASNAEISSYIQQLKDKDASVRFKLPDALGGVTIPIRTLLFIEAFNYHPRVLDAWVAARIDSAREGFWKKNTVRDRSIHIPIPVILDGNNIFKH